MPNVGIGDWSCGDVVHVRWSSWRNCVMFADGEVIKTLYNLGKPIIFKQLIP